MTQWADPNAVERAAGNWTEDQIECRLNRHFWTRQMTMLTRHPNGLLVVEQRCGRGCGVSRQATMNGNTGYLVGEHPWRPKYPKRDDDEPNYLMPAGTGRVDSAGQARLRLLSFRNLSVVDVPDD